MNLIFITESRLWQYVKNVSDLKKQLVKFTLIGLTAVFVDLTCYYVLLNILPEKIFGINNEAVAKAISFICGMAVTYSFNKRWTWRQNNRSKIRIIKFAVLYSCSLLVNVSVNSGLIYILHNNPIFSTIPLKYLIAFVGATGVSSLINFTGQKFWVFKN